MFHIEIQIFLGPKLKPKKLFAYKKEVIGVFFQFISII
jgi:hypothetical protein